MSISEDLNKVHVVHCRECDDYHRMNIKATSIGNGPVERLPDELLVKLFRCEIKCPKTGETFVAAEDDWVHLTEQEFEKRCPKRS